MEEMDHSGRLERLGSFLSHFEEALGKVGSERVDTAVRWVTGGIIGVYYSYMIHVESRLNCKKR